MYRKMGGECHDETITQMVTETIIEQQCTDKARQECHDETVTEMSLQIKCGQPKRYKFPFPQS